MELDSRVFTLLGLCNPRNRKPQPRTLNSQLFMTWQGIEGHDDVAAQFSAALERDRLASTFLFVGPQGIGKRTFAIKFAQSLFCPMRPLKDMNPCGQCPACRQVKAETHPDLILVSKPAERRDIPIKLLIGENETRGREGLCHDIAIKPYMGHRRVAIVDDADFLNEAGANCLLKTLEEPPPGSVLILISTSLDRQLPTIRSRSQIIRFRPLEPEIVAKLLLEHEIVDDPRRAERLAKFSEGSLGRAKQLLDPAIWDFRATLLQSLSEPFLDSLGLSSTLSSFVDEAGKDAQPRRDRMRLLIGFASEFYRQLLRTRHGAAWPQDADLRSAIERAEAHWQDIELIEQALERCAEALTHVDRNVHKDTLLESWLDALSRTAAGEFCG